MYKLRIKDKHSLVDLATYGTRARKKIHSEILIGDKACQSAFKEGDILDANATFNLIQDTCGQNAITKYADQQEAQLKKLAKIVYDDQDTVGNLDQKVDDLKQEQEQDIATVEQHIQQAKDEVTDYFSIRNRFVYDGPEENLMIIR